MPRMSCNAAHAIPWKRTGDFVQVNTDKEPIVSSPNGLSSNLETNFFEGSIVALNKRVRYGSDVVERRHDARLMEHHHGNQPRVQKFWP